MVWRGELIADVELPDRGPAVFVANHAGPIGPIGVAAALPFRLYPWVVGDMVDHAKAGPYLLDDFVVPELHLPRVLAAPVSTVLSIAAVWVLRNIGCIPVGHDRNLLETYRRSEDLLADRHCLLIFPEDPIQPVGRGGLRPFKTGFAHLGSLHRARTGRSLGFFPVAVHRMSRWIHVGRPVYYNARTPDAVERRRVAHLLEQIIASTLEERRESLAGSLAEPP